MTAEKNSEQITEYRVVYTLTPYPRWEVQYLGKKMGYKVWDQRVATNAAKEMARGNRPAKVIIQDEQGKVVSEVPYAARRK